MSDGTNIRRDFAEILTSEDRAEIVTALKEFLVAGKSTRFYCAKCNHENQVETPDAKVRLDTLKFMVDQGLGKLLEKPADDRDELERRLRTDMANMTDAELLVLADLDNDPKWQRWAKKKR